MLPPSFSSRRELYVELKLSTSLHLLQRSHAAVWMPSETTSRAAGLRSECRAAVLSYFLKRPGWDLPSSTPLFKRGRRIKKSFSLQGSCRGGGGGAGGGGFDSLRSEPVTYTTLQIGYRMMREVPLREGKGAIPLFDHLSCSDVHSNAVPELLLPSRLWSAKICVGCPDPKRLGRGN